MAYARPYYLAVPLIESPALRKFIAVFMKALLHVPYDVFFLYLYTICKGKKSNKIHNSVKWYGSWWPGKANTVSPLPDPFCPSGTFFRLSQGIKKPVYLNSSSAHSLKLHNLELISHHNQEHVSNNIIVINETLISVNQYFFHKHTFCPLTGVAWWKLAPKYLPHIKRQKPNATMTTRLPANK